MAEPNREAPTLDLDTEVLDYESKFRSILLEHPSDVDYLEPEQLTRGLLISPATHGTRPETSCLNHVGGVGALDQFGSLDVQFMQSSMMGKSKSPNVVSSVNVIGAPSTVTESDYTRLKRVSSTVFSEQLDRAGRNQAPPEPIFPDRHYTMLCTGKDSPAIVRALLWALYEGLRADFTLNSEACLIQGQAYQGAQRVSFSIRVTLPEGKESGFLVEFQRLSGDSVEFHRFYRSVIQTLRICPMCADLTIAREPQQIMINKQDKQIREERNVSSFSSRLPSKKFDGVNDDDDDDLSLPVLGIDGGNEDENDGSSSEQEEQQDDEDPDLILKPSLDAKQQHSHHDNGNNSWSAEATLLDMMTSDDAQVRLEGLSVLAQLAQNAVDRARIGEALLKLNAQGKGSWLDLLEDALSSSDDDMFRCCAMLCADVLSLKHIGETLMKKIAGRSELVETLLAMLGRPESCGESYGDLNTVSIEAKRQIARVLYLLSGSYPQLLRTGVPVLQTCRSTTNSDPRLVHFTQLALRNLDKAF